MTKSLTMKSQMKKSTIHEDDKGANYMPTEEEIALACRQLQSTWSPREERKRRGAVPNNPLLNVSRLYRQGGVVHLMEE